MKKTNYIEIWTEQKNSKLLAKLFLKNNEDIRIVGGAVRDILSGKIPHDCDMATTATPDTMMKLGKELNIKTIPSWEEYCNNVTSGGLKHGTVSFVINDEVIEVTTLRTDINTDGRHADVEFVRDFKKDAERRDLTFNACSIDIDGTLYDYFNGQDDLKKGIIRFVGNPEKRIQEDYLRILRFFRFMARFGKDKNDELQLEAIKNNTQGIKMLSGERIQSEIFKMLEIENGILQFDIMNQLGVLKECELVIYNIEKDFLKHISNLTKDPNIILGILWNKYPEIDMIKVFDRWKMNNESKKTINFIKKYFYLENEPFEVFRNMTMDNNKNLIIALLTAFNRPDDIEKIKNMSPLILPINGNDLKKLGYNGMEIGEKIKEAKIIWFESDCKTTKDDILNQLIEKKLKI